MSISHPNPSVALAETVVDELVRGGVTRFALSPGSRSGALARAVQEHPEAALAVMIDERSACFFAMGAARMSKNPEAVITTSGTAAANLFPGVVEADLSEVPLIVLTADRPPELRQTGANQTIDQIKLFGSNVRWFWEAGVAEDRSESNSYWRSSTARAVAEAHGWGGRPGPVHLNLVFREPTAPRSDDGRSQSPPFGSSTRGRPRRRSWTANHPAPRLDLSFLKVINKARRGVLVVGEHAGQSEPYYRLAERLGWPVLAEAISGTRGPLSISTFHHLLGGLPDALRPDLAFCFGKTGLSHNLSRLLSDPSILQIVVGAPGGWTDPNRAVSHMVAGSAAAVARAMLDRVTERKKGGWVERWQDADRRCRLVIDKILDENDEVTEPRTARDLAEMPFDALVLGSSMPVRAVDWFARTTPSTVIGNRGASGIDGLVSTALGAAWTHPGRRVACLTGDLALLHDSNGFLVDERPSAVFVVINNNGGGIFSFLPQAHDPHFERLFGAPHGRDFKTLATFHDLEYRRLEQASQLAPTIEEAFGASGLWLVEARTDRKKNRKLYERITRQTCRHLTSLP